MKQHHYTVQTNWTGNLGSGTSTYRAYSRAHETAGASKSVAIPGSSDPAFRGDASRYNPEELLLAALANCHMLWVLHYCADAGIIVTEYRDAPEGIAHMHADGSGEFTSVVLKPRMKITDASRIEDAKALHAEAHAVCCIARSVRFPVSHEPVVEA